MNYELIKHLELRSSLLTFGSANKFALLSLNRNLLAIYNVDALLSLVQTLTREVIDSSLVDIIVNVNDFNASFFLAEGIEFLNRSLDYQVTLACSNLSIRSSLGEAYSLTHLSQNELRTVSCYLFLSSNQIVVENKVNTYRLRIDGTPFSTTAASAGIAVTGSR